MSDDALYSESFLRYVREIIKNVLIIFSEQVYKVESNENAIRETEKSTFDMKQTEKEYIVEDKNKGTSAVNEFSILNLINAWYELQKFYRGGGGTNDFNKIEKWEKYSISDGKLLRGTAFDDEFRSKNRFFHKNKQNSKNLDYISISDGHKTIKIYRKDKKNLRRFFRLIEKLRIRKIQIERLGHKFTSKDLSRKIDDYDLSRYLVKNIPQYRGMKLKKALSIFKTQLAQYNELNTNGNVICEICGNDKKVEIHHIFARIWVFFILGVKMHEYSNLKLVCNTCHQKIWHPATDILDGTTPMEPKYSIQKGASEKEILKIISKIKKENPEKIEKLTELIKKHIKLDLEKQQLDDWINRFLSLSIGSLEFLKQYNQSRKINQKNVDSNKALESYYETIVNIEDFNPIETYEKFLKYFKMKDEISNTTYKSEFLQHGFDLLNEIKTEEKKYLDYSLNARSGI